MLDPDLLSCKVILYADDTLFYHTVNDIRDVEVFQMVDAVQQKKF